MHPYAFPEIYHSVMDGSRSRFYYCLHIFVLLFRLRFVTFFSRVMCSGSLLAPYIRLGCHLSNDK
uniref:Uncharacterized protein n=1 Tax=Rhizophora mucronata TaxID=61149 RepID=A0A2P2NP54_RHIMU